MGGGPVVIPAVFVGQEDGENFIPAAGEMVEISANDDLTGGIDVDYPGDWTASFSSIGPRSYDSALKPEVSAPGVNINAAAVGSGTGTASMQGTSMASPHLAGVAALLKQARPNWTVEQIKAAIMNTAVDMDPESTSPINIPTVGAGRVDAQAATETMAVAVGDEDLVSLSFGVIFDGDGDGDGMKTVSKDVTLYNWESTTQTFAVTSTFQTGSWTTGIMVETDVDEVMVPAGGMATVMVTVTVETGKIPVVYGLLEEVYGFVKFTNTATDAMLRVPFYFSPRPYTELEVTGDGTIMDPVNDVLTYAITHTGAISSSLYPMDALIKDSEELTESQHVDINMVGAETWVGGYGTVVSLGIDTYGYWTTPSSHLSALEVYVDLDEDGTDDIKLYPYNLSQWQYGSISDPDDSWILLQDTLATTQTVEQNLASPYYIYTDYNSGYTEWYIVASWIGVSAANPDFDFWVKTESWEGYEDMTAKADYSIVAPAFNVDVPAALGPYAPVGAVKVSIASAEGYNAYEPLGVMLLDYNGDPREGGQAYYMPITVENLADVTIDKMVETAMTPVAPGETVTYTVVLANASDTVTATDVTMLDELPVVMAFGEWIEEPAGTTQVGRTISWMGDLYPSEVMTFTFTADLYEQDQTNYLGLEEIVNVATHDYVGGGSDAASFDWLYFDLSKAYASSAVVGTPITYTLTVTNVGSSVATNVVLSDTIPDGVTEVSGSVIYPWVWWIIDTIPAEGGVVTETFSGVLPCSGDVVNDEYLVARSDQGVSSDYGPPVTTTVVAPALVAGFEQSAASALVSDTVTFTDTSTTNGPSFSHLWDFGDGGQSSGAVADHAYTTDGTFTVTLTVTDTCGYSDVATGTVSITAPALVAGFEQSAASALVSDTVTFTDTSTTDVPPIAAWTWDFGDGSQGSGAVVDHAYTTDGTFTVTLTVTDTLGYSDVATGTVTITAPTLVAGFEQSAASVLVGETVAFTDTSTPDGPGFTRVWDFGDGSQGRGAVADHAYTTDGTFTVTLTVTDTLGRSDAATSTVTVAPPTLVASFDQSATTAEVGVTLSFTDTSTTNVPPIAAWAWDFGDGSALVTTQNATHVYSRKGTYTVILTITDAFGYVDTATSTVTINPAGVKLHLPVMVLDY
jgi:uncharacterized repeat protein (TIGR01451 family)